jgi:hypothetical protein
VNTLGYKDLGLIQSSQPAGSSLCCEHRRNTHWLIFFPSQISYASLISVTVKSMKSTSAVAVKSMKSTSAVTGKSAV